MKHITHTPGPWVLQKTPSRIEVKQDALHTLNFVLNDEANARLIAASPELLDALLLIVDTGFHVKDEYGHVHWAISEKQRAIARAAIAKAME